MIASVRLTRAGLDTTRLGFGGSRLHYLDARGRANLLAEAVDLGLRHIDVAPLYGDGLAEREIGRVLGKRRDNIILATKFGLAPNPLINAAPALGGVVRAARALGRKAGLFAPRRERMRPEALRASLEGSLRRLRTDRVDLLLLHEPTPKSLPFPEPVLEELVELKRRGLIRAFGLAGSWEGIAALAEWGERLGEVIQTGEREWPQGRPPEISFGAIAAEPQTVGAARTDPTRAVARMRDAFLRRPNGVLLVSSTHPEHLRALAQAAEEVAG